MAISTTIFSLYTVSLSLLALTSAFTPADHYLIDCGSHSPDTLDLSHRRFVGDSSELAKEKSVRLTSTRTIQLADPNPPADSSLLYHTARVFKTPSKYSFAIRERGTHLVRLHFSKFDNFHCEFNFSDAQFHVSANGYVLLYNFNVGTTENFEIIKDYMIWVDSEILEIMFVPSHKSKFAFVNAIEVISAPKDLVADLADHVNNGKTERISGLLKNGYETVHRINVGGPKVTPFNDSLWRTWIPDDQFLKSSNGSSQVFFTGRIKYQMGGASREVGPDNVYSSARVIRSLDDKVPESRITWEFPVIQGYKYLVRMHFCDIASEALDLLYFNAYLNGNLVYENLDLSRITNRLASPFYADCVVDGESSGLLTVSVGPSNMSSPRTIDAILNGVEIMKMNNSMGSFSGEVCPGLLMKSWRRGNAGIVFPLVAVVFLLIVASVVMQRRTGRFSDYLAWSPLSVDASEVISLKYGNQVPSGKV